MTNTDYAKELRALPNYMASEDLHPLLQWKPSQGGHVLVTKESQEVFIGVAVVYVYDNKLNCGPNGNFLKPEVGSLMKAKYQLQAGRPGDQIFGPDFKKMYELMAKLQTDVGKTNKHTDLLIPDPSAKIIRFARSVFEERPQPVKAPSSEVYLEDVMDTGQKNTGQQEDESELIDDETSNWPLPPGRDFAAALNEIKCLYRAVPLRVYKDSEFIEPQDVNNVLRDATVEIQFSLRHVHLGTQNPPRDSFRANIEQIVVLKAGKIHNAAFRTSDPRAGPIKAGTAMTMKRVLPVEEASTSSKAKKTKKDERDPKGKGKAVDNAEVSDAKGKGKAVDTQAAEVSSGES